MKQESINKRIAKNTLFLYSRTLITMFISLFTSRVVLDVLGEQDYGIYNLVGGIVVFFTFFNNALSASTQRFLNFEIGRNDPLRVNQIFSISITVHVIILLLIFALGEAAYFFVFDSVLNIPPDRLNAAKIVYQVSLIGCCINILRIPYNAAIIAYEEMSFYAYISIVEVLLKLIIVYALTVFVMDSLILYSFLMLFIICFVNSIFYVYCKRKYETCHYKYCWNSLLVKKLLSFSGWSLAGGIANVGVSQGIGVLLNIFYTVSINAAIGIANQVQGTISAFVFNFQTAFTPQIVKSYASNNINKFYSLVCRSSRLSYCLIFMVAPALMVCMDQILGLWLTVVPKYTASFINIFIVYCMIDALSGPLWVSVQASGDIKRYQISTSLLIIINLPLMAGLLLLNISPIIVVGVRSIINAFTHFYRIFYLSKNMNFPAKFYMKEVMCRSIGMTVCALPLCIFSIKYCTDIKTCIFIACMLIVQNIFLVFFIGLYKDERLYIKRYAFEKIKEFRNL